MSRKKIKHILLESFIISLITLLVVNVICIKLKLTSLHLSPIINLLNYIPFIPKITKSITINHFNEIIALITSTIIGFLIFKQLQNHIYTCSIGKLHWDRNAFCRGWLITGSTGSGKTQCGINILLHQVFQNENGIKNENGVQEYPWGGLCIDEKGLYWEILSEMASHYGRSKDLVLLQTKPDHALETWNPTYRLNLLSDSRIPSNTYASAIVNTACSVSGSESDKGFFKTQSESQIGWAIELYRSINAIQKSINTPINTHITPNLKNVLEILTNQEKYEDLIAPFIMNDSPTLLKNFKLQECLTHFRHRYWNQPKDQLGGVQSTIYNYLNYFSNDEVAQVFCTNNTFDFNEIEKGKIVCVSMPQKLQVERRYVCTLLKLLFYTQVLRRFDMPKEIFNRKNLLICWQDEAQRFITEADGNVDVIREAGATTVLACQSKTSLHPPLGGKEKANVTILNLRNRMIFKASDEDCAKSSAEFIGKEEISKKTKSVGKNTSRTYSKVDSFRIKPHELRELKDFVSIIYHSSGTYKKYLIAAKTPTNEIPKWWYQKIPLLTRVFLFLLPFKPNFLKKW